MADFESAITYVLANEGGYVNNPADPGGETNYGITAATLSRYLDPTFPKSVKDLTVEQAKSIYRKFYWDTLGLEDWGSQAKATAMLDVAVNRGVGRARRYNNTIDELLRGGVYTDSAFIRALVDLLSADYKAIVAHDTTKEVFLKGWLSRANRLLTLINA